ncbi:MAG: ABC transporter permease [Butyrivibrio sp.]|uniref:ABC transporter permease n=1 Tax=Butyrivibrio sp. TaxID=28121 RepID=UPI0025E826D2|nr:ABC transporter permease [Butyrivibrio sp.]MCR5769990.1 ABC transporter permease [Butyrivibrio sp.]
MKYILKKAGMMLLTLFVVSVLVFLAFNLIPGDPATRILGIEATENQLAILREEMGLNDPLYVRYFRWVWAFIHGDLGQSYSYGSVSELILDKIPITIWLAIMAFILMIVISIPLGIFTARHEGGTIDKVVVVLDQIIMAIPPFFSGIILTLVFGLTLHLFVPGGFVSYKKDFWGFIEYLIFPAIAIALPKITMSVKLLRGSVIDEISKDYTRTAYSRGNTTRGVLYRHVLKNAMIPVITFMGMALADMVSGSIVIEQVFNIPGLGRMLLTSINNRDYPVVEAIIMGIAILVMVVNFIVDIIYRLVDPRIETIKD